MNICHCGGVVIEPNSYTRVCTTCGREVRFLSNEIPGYQQAYGILKTPTCYSRIYRFKVLFSKAVLRTSVHFEDPIWEYLKTETYKTVQDIKQKLSKLKGRKNKRYDLLPLFSHIFLHVDLPTLTQQQFERGLRIFEEIHRRWKQARLTRFFSYYYLLEVIFRTMKLDKYIVVSKQLICQKRHQRYNELLTRLGFILTKCEKGVFLNI